MTVLYHSPNTKHPAAKGQRPFQIDPVQEKVTDLHSGALVLSSGGAERGVVGVTFGSGRVERRWIRGIQRGLEG